MRRFTRRLIPITALVVGALAAAPMLTSPAQAAPSSPRTVVATFDDLATCGIVGLIEFGFGSGWGCSPNVDSGGHLVFDLWTTSQ
jgi:hypothetical protein